MKRKLFHCLICSVLMIALLFGTLPGTAPVKVSASQPGNWICTGYTYDQGYEEYLGNVHEMQYNYDEQSGVVKYYRKTTFSNDDGTFSAYWDSTCSIPPASFPGDSEVRMQIYTEVSGNTMDNMIFINSCYVKEGQNSTLYFYKDGTYQSGYVSAVTGPDYTKSEALTVWREIDAGRNAGDTTEIVFYAGLGRGEDGWMRIIWNYEWVPDAEPTPTPEPTPEPDPEPTPTPEPDPTPTPEPDPTPTPTPTPEPDPTPVPEPTFTPTPTPTLTPTPSPSIDKTIKVGKKTSFKAKKKITNYYVSDFNIAKVKAKGKKLTVKGMKPGVISIIAYSNKGKVVGSWMVKIE